MNNSNKVNRYLSPIIIYDVIIRSTKYCLLLSLPTISILLLKAKRARSGVCRINSNIAMTCRLSVSSYYQLLFIITITNYQYFRHNVTKRHKTEQSRHETSNYTLISLVPFIIITINIVFSLLVIYSYQIKKKTQRGSLQPKQTKVIVCLVIDLLTCTSKCFIANMCNCTNYCLLLLLLFN